MELSKQTQHRRAVQQCPCGKPNKNRKGAFRFVPYVDGGHVVPGAGYCHSCAQHFAPSSSAEVAPVKREPLQWHFAPSDAVTNSLSTSAPLLRQLSKNGFDTAALSRYSVGNFYGRNAFWLQDSSGRFVTAQLQSFDERLHNQGSSWLHAEHNPSWPKSDFIPAFGEHLIDEIKPVAVVEAAKTALICAAVFSEFTWVATLGAGRLSKFLDRNKRGNIMLFPDNDAAGQHWVDIAKKQGVKAFTDYWRQCATGEDFADLILEEMH